MLNQKGILSNRLKNGETCEISGVPENFSMALPEISHEILQRPFGSV
jgi:hypothetical protein